MTVRLLMRDVRFGFSFVAFSLVAAAFLGMLFSIGSAGLIVYKGGDTSAYSMGDFLAHAFDFSAPLDLWQLIQGRPLSITFPWFFPTAVLFSSLSEYLRSDARGAGYRVMLASGSRWAWWVAKCLWVCLVVCAFWAIYLGMFLITSSVFFDVSPTLSVTQEGLAFIKTGLVEPIMVDMTIFPLIALLVPVCIALALVQSAISLLVDRMLGYVLTMGVLFASAMVYHPLLIGNYLISGRCPGIFADAFGMNWGLALSLVLAWIGVAVGGMFVSRMTIYGGSRDE